MQRIVKRFLLHNERESKGSKKGFIEFKQDLQLCRYELLNGMRRKKHDSFQVQNLIHTGLNLLGDEIFKRKSGKKSQLNMLRFIEYKKLTSEIRLREDQDLESNSEDQSSTEIDRENYFPEQNR
jgi:hypothetical protein